MAQIGIIRNTTAQSQVSASDFASIFNATYGDASGIIDYKDKLSCTKVNDNTVRLGSGIYSLKGYMIRVTEGTTADLTVESGTLGMSRIDLLVATYYKNGFEEGTDLLQFEIVKGTPVTSNPVAPDITQGDVNASDTKRQEILYVLNIEGTTLTVGTRMSEFLPSLNAIQDEVIGIDSRVTNLESDTGWIAMTLLNGNTPVGGSAQRCSYRKKNGIVYVVCDVNTAGFNSSIATLPSGFRPSIICTFAVLRGTSSARGYVNIDGSVNFGSISGSDTVTGMNVICYPAA